MPACEHSSFLPGDPETPTAPTTSSPALIGKPPDTARTRLYSLEPTDVGSFTISLNELSGRGAEGARGVGLAVRSLGGVQAGAIAAPHHEGQAGAVNHDHRDLEAQYGVLVHRGFGD